MDEIANTYVDNIAISSNIFINELCEYIIDLMYTDKCKCWSDIYEHLPTLYKLATFCESILELGVRGCVSSWAFSKGLLHNSSDNKLLICNDLEQCDIQKFKEISIGCGVQIQEHWCNDLDLSLNTMVDMTFIDTWHVYGQLKRELKKFAPITKKMIVMHDTTSDGEHGETIRMHQNVDKMQKISGFPKEEILKGLWPAVEEFLADHSEWILVRRYSNCNGLTILARKEVAFDCLKLLD